MSGKPVRNVRKSKKNCPNAIFRAYVLTLRTQFGGSIQRKTGTLSENSNDTEGYHGFGTL